MTSYILVRALWNLTDLSPGVQCLPDIIYQYRLSCEPLYISSLSLREPSEGRLSLTRGTELVLICTEQINLSACILYMD